MQAHELQRIAVRAFPVIQAAAILHKSKELTDYDFVGIYILALAAARRASWCSGRLKTFPGRLSETLGDSVPLEVVSGLVELLGGIKFIQKKLGSRQSIGVLTVQDIFNELQLTGVKHNKNGCCVNTTMVQWGLGNRPFVVMSVVPSPMEVLRQQAFGTRVVTVFLTEAELQVAHSSQLMYMHGAPTHSRDAFEFTLHDLKHMEHFCDEDSHLEQRGFFTCMLRLGNGNPREFFCTSWGLDGLFWNHLEYVISDMNCFVPHLMQYTLAKIVEAVNREQQGKAENTREHSKLERMHQIWCSMLDGMGITTVDVAARQAADALFQVIMHKNIDKPHLTREEAEILRCWFRQQIQ